MIPIPNAIAIVRTALYGALCPLVGTYQGRPRCYWQIATEAAPLPLLVFQSQDIGGRDASYLALGGWEGLITVKALASSDAAAEMQLSGVYAALESMPHPRGYTIHCTLDRPLTVPPGDGVYTAGLIVRVRLYRAR
jgi:hypothetical protein